MNKFSIFSILLLLTVLLMHSNCNKTEEPKEIVDYSISREDFINLLKGEWYVYSYSVNGYRILYSYNDSIWCYHDNVENNVKYDITDTIICTLPKIENIQNWNITEHDSVLDLEITNLCGEFLNYRIEFSNCHYGNNKSTIYANITLIGKDTINPSDFNITEPYVYGLSDELHFKKELENHYNENETFDFYRK